MNAGTRRQWQDHPVHSPSRPLNPAGLQTIREFHAAVWGAWFAGVPVDRQPTVPKLLIPTRRTSPLRAIRDADLASAEIVAPRLGDVKVWPGAVYEVAFLVALWNWQEEWDGRRTPSAHWFAQRLQNHYFEADLRAYQGWELLREADDMDVLAVKIANSRLKERVS